MAFRRTLRAVMLGLFLVMGSLGGVPMRVEDIETLMHSMNQTKISQTIPIERDEVGGPPK